MNKRTVGRVASALAVLTLGGVGYSAAARRRNPYYDGPVSDHFDGIRFHQPAPSPDRGVLDLARFQLGGGSTPWPARYPSPFSDTPPARSDELRVVLVGHSTLLIQVAGLNILTDPIWSARASPVRFAGPSRVNPPGVAFDDLPPIDVVLVSHNHYDHLDVVTLSRLSETFRPRVITPLGNDTIIRAYDDDVRTECLDWGDSLGLGHGVAVHCLPANHWSARGVNDRRMALWAAFLLTTPHGTVYFAGDTGYGEGVTFRSARERFGPPRLAALPIGAYEPRWFMRPQHLNPADAVQAALDLGAEAAIGIHWGTFQLTNEGVDQPAADLATARDAAGMRAERFTAFRPGEVWSAE